MTLPTCSIVVPTHRRPDQLRSCLAAIAALDYPRERVEVIVVDDGGHLPSRQIAPGVRLVRQPRSGPAAARNRGAQVAGAELLAFTDDDCRPARGWLRGLAERYAPHAGCAVGGRTLNSLRANPFASTAQLILDVRYARTNADPDAARFFATNNLAFPRAEFVDIGGFDERYRAAEDRDLCDRWVSRGLPLVYAPSAVVEHDSDLDLRGFLRQNVSYGQGAFHFHRDGPRAGGQGGIVDPAYYLMLARATGADRHGLGRAKLSALLLAWQAANAAGFASESWRSLRRRGAAASPARRRPARRTPRRQRAPRPAA